MVELPSLKTLIFNHADVNKFTGMLLRKDSSAFQFAIQTINVYVGTQSQKTAGVRCKLCVAMVLSMVKQLLETCDISQLLLDANADLMWRMRMVTLH
jgi:hypothetical protein